MAHARAIVTDRHRAPPKVHELVAIRYRKGEDAAYLVVLFDALETAQGTQTF